MSEGDAEGAEGDHDVKPQPASRLHFLKQVAQAAAEATGVGPLRVGALLIVGGATLAWTSAWFSRPPVQPRWLGVVLGALALPVGALVSYVGVQWGERNRLSHIRFDLDAARARVDAGEADRSKSRLDAKAIEAYAEELRAEIGGLNRRAVLSFIPGVLLCTAALAGPAVSLYLVSGHPDHWQLMLGGGTLAAVLLGAGSALLRHDNKLREQVHAARGELLYFNRLRTGLDCARVLSDVEYRDGLKLVTAHLLAAPPAIAPLTSAAGADDNPKAKDDPPKADGKAEPEMVEKLNELLSEFIKKAAEGEKTKAG